MDAGRGNSSGGGHQPVAVQYLSRPARPPDGRGGIRDGEVRGRLRDFVPERGGSPPSAGTGAELDRYDGTATASDEDADRGRHRSGWLRLSGLSLRRGDAMAPAKEPGQAEGHAACQDPAYQRAKSLGHHHEPEPHAARLVRIFPAQPRDDVHGARSMGAHPAAEHPAQTPGPTWSRSRRRPSALAECLLHGVRVVLLAYSPCDGLSILWEVRPPTGEPDAGDPPVRFGGRGNGIQSILPTPIKLGQPRRHRWFAPLRGCAYADGMRTTLTW